MSDDDIMDVLERRQTTWGHIWAVAVTTVLIGCFAFAHEGIEHAGSALTEYGVANTISEFALSAMGGLPILYVMKTLDVFVRRHWITSYYIDAQAEVLRVVGSVKADDLSFVKARVLAKTKRPNDLGNRRDAGPIGGASGSLMGWTPPSFQRPMGATGAHRNGDRYSTKGVQNECYYRCGGSCQECIPDRGGR